MSQPPPQHWIVVADSPFLPATGGGQREHLGFVQAAAERKLIAALVVPIDADPERVQGDRGLVSIQDLLAPAPVITVPRRRSLRAAVKLSLPYVVASRPAPTNLADRLRSAAPHADAVVLYSYKAHQIGRVLAESLHLPAVLRQHNLEGDYHKALAAAAKPPGAWATWLEAVRIDRDERKLEHAPWLTGIADISFTDAAVRRIRASVPVEHVSTFAMDSGLTHTPTQRRPADRPTVVFLGALDVATNIDAIEWFAAKVWPIIAEEAPAAIWQVVGRQPSAALRKLLKRTPRTQLYADVAKPADYLAAAWVAVNPTVSGSGVNIKLVEYLVAGVPVVTTMRGWQGLGFGAVSGVQVADDQTAFARYVIDVLTLPYATTHHESRSRLSALELLNPERNLARLARLLVP